jgi:hypothetical protein
VKKETKSQIEKLKSAVEKERRTKDVAIILSAVKFKTQEKRNRVLEALSNSDLPIDVIKETYEPLSHDKTRFGIY